MQINSIITMILMERVKSDVAILMRYATIATACKPLDGC